MTLPRTRKLSPDSNASAVVVLARRSVYDLPTILICVVSLAVLFRWKLPESVLIACAAVAGLLLHHA
jgi:chromate transporter